MESGAEDWPNAEEVVLVVALPKAGVDVNDEGVLPNAAGEFEGPEPLDPKVNADAGMAPNGDDPNEEFKPDAPPPKADWFPNELRLPPPPPKVFCVAPPKAPPLAPPSNLPLG